MRKAIDVSLLVSIVAICVFSASPVVQARDESLMPVANGCPSSAELENMTPDQRREVLASELCQGSDEPDPIGQSSPSEHAGASSSPVLNVLLELMGTAGATWGSWLLLP